MPSARPPFRRARDRRRDPAARGLLADWHLEDRCLLATAPYAFPAPTVSSLGQVMYDGVTDAPRPSRSPTTTRRSTSTRSWRGEHPAGGRPIWGDGRVRPLLRRVEPGISRLRRLLTGRDGLRGPAAHDVDHDHRPAGVLGLGADHLLNRRADQFQTYGTTASGAPADALFYFQYANTQMTFFGTIAPNCNQLTFTPVYNSFDSNGSPVADTSTPVSTGLFFNGQAPSVVVGNQTYTATVNSSDPNTLTLSGTVQGGVTTPTAFTFTPVPPPPGAPDLVR